MRPNMSWRERLVTIMFTILGEKGETWRVPVMKVLPRIVATNAETFSQFMEEMREQAVHEEAEEDEEVAGDDLPFGGNNYADLQVPACTVEEGSGDTQKQLALAQDKLSRAEARIGELEQALQRAQQALLAEQEAHIELRQKAHSSEHAAA
jgi:hypothetical protein